MWEGPTHCGWCHPWASGLRFYKKTEWASHEEEVSKQHPLHDLCISSCLQVPVLTSFDNEQWYGSISQINSFHPELAWIWCFISAIANLSKITLAGWLQSELKGLTNQLKDYVLRNSCSQRSGNCLSTDGVVWITHADTHHNGCTLIWLVRGS